MIDNIPPGILIPLVVLGWGWMAVQAIRWVNRPQPFHVECMVCHRRSGPIDTPADVRLWCDAHVLADHPGQLGARIDWNHR